MIKFLPEIYPDEAIYSYLSRCFARSGFIWNSGFSKEVFGKALVNIDYSFPRVFAPEFRQLIEDKIGLQKLILDHTLFKYYARFLPLEKRQVAFEKAMDNQQFLERYLPTTRNVDTSCLRYCPKCAKEDRLNFGEAYIHIEHTIPDIHICPKHCCELVSVDFISNKHNNTDLIPLELSIKDRKAIVLDEEDINVKVAKYITEAFKEPFILDEDFSVGNFLSNKLEGKYISPRGEQRYIEELSEDMKIYYTGLYQFNLTKNKLAYIFRSLAYNPYDILLVSMFQKISPSELCGYKGSSVPKYILFDNKVRQLYQSGLTMGRISAMLGVNHEVVRQVLLGTYDKPKKACSPYKCQRWDWGRIEEKCCRDFSKKIKKLDGKKITKATVAKLLGLKDKTLRNLPRLKNLIQEYKKELNHGIPG